jgi:alcohol dehydrogenase class IV
MDSEATLGLRPADRKAEAVRVLKRLLPYAIILFATLAAFLDWIFQTTITGGDDANMRIAAIYDLYYGFQNGFFVGSTSHLSMGIFAYNTYIFYGPFPDFIIALNAYLFSWMGVSVLVSIKVMSILSVFLSGVFAYKLTARIVGDKPIGVALGVAYVFMPYRLLCIFLRFALPEAFAIGFIPMFFYGLYGIIHDEKVRVGPYVNTILGASLMVLSHPFTAVMASIAGLLYLIFNVMKVIKVFKSPRRVVYILISFILIFGIVFFFAVPMLKALHSGYYRVSDAAAMGTTLEHIQGNIWKSYFYSGFPEVLVFVVFYFSFMVYPLSVCLAYFVNHKLKKWLNSGWKVVLRAVIFLIVLYLPALLLGLKRETIIALTVFAVYFFAFVFNVPRPVADMDFRRRELKFLWKDPNTYYLLLSILVCNLLLFCGPFWEIMPSFMYMCQFPFRVWGICGFLLFLLVAHFVRPLKGSRSARQVLSAAAAYLLVFSTGNVTARLVFGDMGFSVYQEPDVSFMKEQTKPGWQDEYAPDCFFDEDYAVRYESGLYYKVQKVILDEAGFLYGEEEYLTPVAVEGSVEEVTVTYLNTPTVTFDVTGASSDTLLQIPQFYADGYVATATYADGTEVECGIKEADGLVAIEVPEGDYSLSVEFANTPLKRAGYVVLAVSIPLTVAFAVYGGVYYKKEERRRLLESGQSLPPKAMNPFSKLYCRAYQKTLAFAMHFLNFREPKALYGSASLADELAERGLKHPLIVTDKTIYGLGLTKPLEEALKKKGIPYSVYPGAVPNPTFSCVYAARDLYLKDGCDSLIGVGGGSSMDTAKAAGALIVNPKKTLDKLGGTLKVLRKIPFLAAIPTTAGTGSEATVAAVVVDEKNSHKFAINDPRLIPEVAVFDDELLKGLPPKVISTTGMDALTHAVEAYIGHTRTKKTKAYSIEAVKLIDKNLPRFYKDAKDDEARKAMLRASYLAGVSFTRSYVGYVHAIAHSLGGVYGIAHGYANAVILPHVLKAYGDTVYRPLSRLSDELHLTNSLKSKKEKAEAFISYVEKLNESFGIPKDFGGLIKDEDLDRLSRMAAKEANPLYPVPKEFSREELKALYVEVNGKTH